MEPYSAEKFLLERHQATVRSAERRARLALDTVRRPSPRQWMAVRLRTLADAIDERPGAASVTELSS